jgi:hypothetical protein
MEITRKDPFTGDINTHNLNITGEEMTLWEKGNTYIQDAFPNLTGDEREFVKTGINIGTFDALKMKTRMKMRMKIFLTTKP